MMILGSKTVNTLSLACGLPAVLVDSVFGGYERFNGVLPGAR
jgi:hypothetical protein